ncbi:hypothetical protein [Gilvimarinus sp. DA14]|uniref:hypothetical protein n=1 Tax=Gilvimarinus sp. DA14 TaxID=2956798 RepID=UPI0020B77C18|nr:hypothetical protein [Gilvimarinus sp. DA14]UTF60242.1 hypothetical protein NHM04_00165 [Gilvimarinus sp. DA14]
MQGNPAVTTILSFGLLLMLSACGGSENGSANSVASSSTSSSSLSSSSSAARLEVTTATSLGGAISPSSATALEGDRLQFEVIPAEGYQLGEVSGCAGVREDLNYVIDSLTGNCEVTAQFVISEPSLEMVQTAPRAFSLQWQNLEGFQEYRIERQAEQETDFTPVQTFTGTIDHYAFNASLREISTERYRLALCDAQACAHSQAIALAAIAQWPTISVEEIGFSPETQEFSAVSGDGNTAFLLYQQPDCVEPGADNNCTHVHIYTLTDAQWEKTQQLAVPDIAVTPFNTIETSYDGSVLAIGFTEYDQVVGEYRFGPFVRDEIAESMGKVHVYEKSGGSWQLEEILYSQSTESYIRFGGSLAVSRDGTLILASSIYDYFYVEWTPAFPWNSSGMVEAWQRTDTGWQLTETVTSEYDTFGPDVAISADASVMISRSPYNENNQGELHFFAQQQGSDEKTWVEVSSATAPINPNPSTYRPYGQYSYLSGDGKSVFILNTTALPRNTGAVESLDEYHFNEGQWELISSDIIEENSLSERRLRVSQTGELYYFAHGHSCPSDRVIDISHATGETYSNWQIWENGEWVHQLCVRHHSLVDIHLLEDGRFAMTTRAEELDMDLKLTLF